MSLVKAYRILRFIAYSTGLVGLLLVMMARSENSQQYFSAGFLLITIAFSCLFVTYLLFVVNRLKRGPR